VSCEVVSAGSPISISYMHSAMGGGAIPQHQSRSVQLDVSRNAIDTTWTSCNHVMQSCCIAYSLVGKLRQHFAEYKYLQ
jgi:hypothetical protein